MLGKPSLQASLLILSSPQYTINSIISMKKRIRVPCSSANLGPGFDVFGLALKASSVLFGPQRFSAVLEVQIEELSHECSAPLNCEIECEGEGSESISHAVDKKYATSYVHKYDIELMPPVSL